MRVVGDIVHRGIDPRLFRILPALLDSGEGGFSFLFVPHEATGGSRIDDRSIDRCPKIDRPATIDRLANGGTLAFFLSSL